MNGDVVARAEAALEGVTEGPWEEYGYSADLHSVQQPMRRDRFGHPEFDVPICSMALPDDAEFIAAARTLVPELVAEVERLRPFSRCPGCGSMDTSSVLHEGSPSIACHVCGYGT